MRITWEKARSVGVVVVAVAAFALAARRIDWPNSNGAAVQIASSSVMSAGCAMGGYNVTSSGVADREELPAYFRAVAAAAGAPHVSFPDRSEWSRDVHLLDWFHAQALVREKRFSESLPYLRSSGMIKAVAASGHIMYVRGDRACAIFNWLLAQELGGVSPDTPEVEPFALDLIRNGDASIVVQAYTTALDFQPARTDWRLILARGLFELHRVSDAVNVLQPLFAGKPNEVSAAEKLMKEYNVSR